MQPTTGTNPFNDFVFLSATPADRGTFTLALDKALDKLEKFQLPDPSFFLLQWVQALVAAGSQIITISLESSFTGYSLRLGFDGPGYTARELQGLYDHVFLSGRDRSVDRLRELALGWLSASSLKPTHLAMRSNGWGRVRGPAGKDVASQLAPETTLEAGSPHLLEIAGRGSYPFEQMITNNCTDVSVPLFLNGTQVSHPSVRTGVPWPNRPFRNGPTEGVMGATYGAGSSSQIAFLRYGVNFVSRTEPALVPPVIMRVSDSTLSKNVSQTDVVRDDAYEEFLVRLRTEMKTMGLSLTGKRIPSYQRDSLNRYLQAYIASHLDIRALEDSKRLALLGADYESLLNYPVFCSNKGIYRSLLDLHALYKKQGSLLYCLDAQARAVAWAGVLLVLELEEVAVLRKFFPNLIGLSLEEVRLQSRMGRSAVAGDGSGNPPYLARQSLALSGRTYRVSVPDCYPTGIAVLQPLKSQYGTAVPGLPLTLAIEYTSEAPPNHNEVVSLQRGISQVLPALKSSLAGAVVNDEHSFSRPRAAELLCEILSFELSLSEPRSLESALGKLQSIPLIGLEDGRLVSLRDIETFLKLVPQVYIGGAFIEGLESGALDPMPEAAKILQKVFPAHAMVATEKIRDRLADNPELRLALRRQTVMKGLGEASDPKRVLERFASEAASEAAELARIESEYRKALEGPVLFVKPDEERLAYLAADSEGVDLPLLNLSTLGSSQPTARVESAGEAPAPPRGLPSMEADLELCRGLDPDLFPERGSVHVERREMGYSFHLASCPPGQGKLILLRGTESKRQPVEQPVRGFLRLAETGSPSMGQLFSEAMEQLTIKAVHAFHDGPSEARMRKGLRTWLFHLSCAYPDRLALSEQRRNDLFDLSVVPCLGDKFLSWRTLLEQARRVGETVVHEGLSSDPPDPQREVIVLMAPLSAELLTRLTFPAQRRHVAPQAGATFDHLYRSTRRDLASVLSGQNTPLLETNLVEELAADASLWKKWRSGFLSWDRESSVVVMNPGHKIGKKLAQRFDDDPSWSRIFASALFSTINRGLEEVEDRHERTFLETLVETLD